jgi:transposase
MAYREVTMLEVKEVLRLWLAGDSKKRIAVQLGLNVKTVRRYVGAAWASGLAREAGPEALDEGLIAAVVSRVQPSRGRPHGDGWAECVAQRPVIERYLHQRVRLSKVRTLLRRQGVSVSYATLRRFAMAELGFGATASTIPVADCGPGEEVQLDTGWMTHVAPDATGRRRRFRAWIFTAVLSRYRFVYPVFRETTETAIEACEAAWAFFHGIFRVLIPDNTKAIVQRADPLEPRLNPTFLEYAQARGFVIDPTRVRRARDKARVERAVPSVRDDCFGGEVVTDLDHARVHARHWCVDDYGPRRHSRTLRAPREHFETVEQPALRPAPTEPYDIPLWGDPKVARDQHAQVARALYSLPTQYVGQTLRARADRTTVRFYAGAVCVKVHPRMPAGGRAFDRQDFPAEKTVYALRDVESLARWAEGHGPAVGQFARALLAGDLPWTRMRQVYALLGLARRYGDARVNAACDTALAVEMLSVRRLARLLELATPPPAVPPARVLPLARYLRPATHYALPLAIPERRPEGGDPA